MKNPHAVSLGKLGGSKKSEAKTRAAKENIKKRWAKKTPPTSPEESLKKLI